MTITEFLEARIAEDQYDANRELLLGTTPMLTRMNARVLDECAAKLSIVDLHPVYIYTDEEPGFSMELNDHACPVGVPSPSVGPCKTLRALAAIYKDHPDYLRTWTP